MKENKFLTLQDILDARPVRNSLVYGLNENVRLIAISNEPKFKEGERIERNTFLTFAQFDEEGKQIASTEFSYFDLDPSKDNTLNNVATQIAQLSNIASIYVPGTEIDPFKDVEEIDIDGLKTQLQSAKFCQKLSKDIFNVFESVVKEHIGVDSTLMRIKVMVNKNNYPQLSSDAIIVEPASVPLDKTNLTMSSYERRVRQEALSNAIAPKASDSVGTAPAKDLLANI